MFLNYNFYTFIVHDNKGLFYSKSDIGSVHVTRFFHIVKQAATKTEVD